jgi:hypothetical protein
MMIWGIPVYSIVTWLVVRFFTGPRISITDSFYVGGTVYVANIVLSMFNGIASQVGSILVIIYMVKVNTGLDWLSSIITAVVVIIMSGVTLAVVGLMKTRE